MRVKGIRGWKRNPWNNASLFNCLDSGHVAGVNGALPRASGITDPISIHIICCLPQAFATLCPRASCGPGSMPGLSSAQARHLGDSMPLTRKGHKFSALVPQFYRPSEWGDDARTWSTECSRGPQPDRAPSL